jgi:hypothetical protein
MTRKHMFDEIISSTSTPVEYAARKGKKIKTVFTSSCKLYSFTRVTGIVSSTEPLITRLWISLIPPLSSFVAPRTEMVLIRIWLLDSLLDLQKFYFLLRSNLLHFARSSAAQLLTFTCCTRIRGHAAMASRCHHGQLPAAELFMGLSIIESEHPSFHRFSLGCLLWI